MDAGARPAASGGWHSKKTLPAIWRRRTDDQQGQPTISSHGVCIQGRNIIVPPCGKKVRSDWRSLQNIQAYVHVAAVLGTPVVSGFEPRARTIDETDHAAPVFQRH